MKLAEIELEPMSAANRAELLRKGNGGIFAYDPKELSNYIIFRVTRNGLIYYIENTETGHIATDHSNPTNLIDFQGAAALLLDRKQNITINKEGNIQL